MKRLVYIVPVALLLFAATTSLVAQEVGGCVDSPENPTVILGLVGIAAIGINQLRARFGGRK